MKLTSFRRLVIEDFAKENQELVGKIAFVLNPTLEQLDQVFNKRVDSENLAEELIVVEVNVNSSGSPFSTLQIKTSLNKVKGITCIKAENITSTTTFPTSMPFISFSINDNLITLTHISGIQASNKYNLTLLLKG